MITGKRLDSPLRYPAAAALAVAATAHALSIREATTLGGPLVALAVACLLLAALLAWRDAASVWVAATLVAASGVVLSVAGDGGWTGKVALAAGALVIVLALAAAALARRPAPGERSRLPLAVGYVVLVGGLVWAGVATAREPGRATANLSGDAMAGMPMQGASYWNDVSGGAFVSDGVTRTYYISADQVVWNYAPRGKNEITGKPFDAVADIYVKSGKGRIGSRYLKCLYRGYTDATFKKRQRRPANQQYLGILGPVIRAEVGDTIKVVFRNNCRFPTSMHPHGVLYSKSSEGAPYNDGTHGADKADDAVPRGHRHTYIWRVPPRSGPGPNDGSSVMWMYHSHTHEIGDTYAGLVGPIEITRRGMARPDGSPKDVDREVFEMFSVMNENNSPYIVQNLHRFARKPYPPLDDDDFNESNLMHSINGYVFGNQPMVVLHKGEHVRWYVMSMGTEVDLHTPHWHGNDVVVNGMRTDVLTLLPATMVVADMVPDNPGIWQFHCHVNDHIRAGMMTRYQVTS